MDTSLRTLFFVIVTSILVSCAMSPTGDVVLEDQPIVIGVNFPLSGGLSIYGDSLLKGLEMGVLDVNTNGGVNGRQIKLVVEDNHGDPRTSATAAHKLISDDGVPIMLTTLVGPVGAIAPITESANVTLLYAAAVDSFAWENQHVWKDSVDAYYDCTLLAAHAASLGKTRIAILGAEAETTEKCKEAILENAGVELVLLEKYVKGETDFRTQLSKISAHDVDVVFLPAFTDDCIIIWKQISELGSDALFVLPYAQTGCGAPQAMAAITTPHLKIKALDFVADEEALSQFLALHNTTYGRDPQLVFFAGIAYDWAHYLALSMETCSDTVTSACIEQGLAKTDYDGIWGKVTYSDRHTTFRERTLIEYTDGSWNQI